MSEKTCVIVVRAPFQLPGMQGTVEFCSPYRSLELWILPLRVRLSVMHAADATVHWKNEELD